MSQIPFVCCARLIMADADSRVLVTKECSATLRDESRARKLKHLAEQLGGSVLIIQGPDMSDYVDACFLVGSRQNGEHHQLLLCNNELHRFFGSATATPDANTFGVSTAV
jgi:hypothetical protein